MPRAPLAISAPALAALLLVATSSFAARRAPALDPQVHAWIVKADSLQSLREWSASDSLARLAIVRLDAATPRDSLVLAYALYQRANARMTVLVARDSLTVATLERAIAIHAGMSRPDTAQWIREMSLISRLYLEMDRPDDALGALATGRSLCTPALASSDSILGELWMYTGRYERRFGRLDLAADALEQSRRRRTRAFGPVHPLIAETLTELGALHTQRLEFTEAQTTLDEAIRIFERALGPNARQLTTPLGHLANLQYQLGDVAGSLESLDRQIALFVAERGPDTPFAFPARFNRCTRLFDFGDYRGALEEYQRLLVIGEREFGPTHSRVRDVLTFAGAAAVACGDSSAKGYLARARALFKSPDPRSNDAHAARWEAERLRRAGHPAAALALVDSQLVGARPRPLDEWVRVPLLETRMESAIALGDRATVRRTIAQLDSLVAARPGAEDALTTVSRRAISRGYAWLGDRDEAWRRALAIEGLERRRLRNNLRALPDRRALEFQNELAGSLDLLLSLAASSHDTARVAVAWDRLVRWRGMVSAEMEHRRLPRGAATDTALVATHDRWLASRGDLARLEVAALTSGDSAALARLAVQSLATAEAERRYAVATGPFATASDTAEVTLAAVRAAMGERRALVSLVELAPRTDSTRVLALVLRGTDAPVTWFDLGLRRELEPWVARWRGAIARPPAPDQERSTERELTTFGGDVRDRTWGRFARLLGDTRDVVIVSDGMLAGMPWGALPVSGGRYLVEAGPRIATPAAERDLLAKHEPSGTLLVAFGDPDFAEMPPGAKSDGMTLASATTSFAPAFRSPLATCAGAGGLTLSSLPGARAEIADVAKEWTAAGGQAVTRVGDEATERAIKSEAPGCAVLHLATHGIVWGDSCTRVSADLRGVGRVDPIAYAPARTKSRHNVQIPPASAPPATNGDSERPAPGSGRRVWLALAGANHATSASDDNDGLLTAEEASSLDLRSVDWVVLSACQSAVGETWPREGSLGMQRAFRLAGAREVIASHWPIGDESTREWMRALYEARARGARDGADALVAADRAVLTARRSSHRTTHPFYWAAFTVSGR